MWRVECAGKPAGNLYRAANQPTMEDILSGKAFKDAAEEDKPKTGKEARAEKRSAQQ